MRGDVSSLSTSLSTIRSTRQLCKMSHTPPKNIVVIGGGISGVSTAYFLATSKARQGAKITLVEGTKIAAGASGYSGGFLAKDWHGSATAGEHRDVLLDLTLDCHQVSKVRLTIDLSAMSYELHAKLAEEFGGKEKWGYRTVDTLVCRLILSFPRSYQSVDFDATRKAKKPSPLQWIPDGTIHSSRSLGGHSTTAQVHPRLLTTFLSDKFVDKENTNLLIGQATSAKVENGSIRAVVVRTDTGEIEVPSDNIVIAAGPWTGELSKDLLGQKIGSKLGVTGHRAHSIVVKTKEELSAHCLFTSMTLEDGSAAEPEVYTRPDGTTYV